MDNKPPCVNNATRIPGQIGWGIERKHLRNCSKLITDDMRVSSYPIKKEHIGSIDKNKTALFTRMNIERSADLDKKLGIDYNLYHSLNMQAQKATLKCADNQRRIN